MEIRTLGSTGLPVTPIGLGLAAVGRPAYITAGRDEDLAGDRSIEALRRRSGELLDAAVGLGIGYVDAARSYGLAESFLASWLAGREPRTPLPTVGSKWGYAYVGEWRLDVAVHEVKDHSLAAFERQLDESRALLGPHLRLYQVHSATIESGVLDDRAVLAALAGAAAEGLAVGLTVSGPGQADVIHRALDVRVDGRTPFASVQATWNVLEPSVGPALATARAAGWGVIVKEAVANGRLVDPAGAPPAVAAIAGRHRVGLDAVALAAALRQPWADVVLSGAATVAQLASNVASLDVRLDAADLDALAGLAEEPGAYWAARSRRPWR